jgi:hypothetical protein
MVPAVLSERFDLEFVLLGVCSCRHCLALWRFALGHARHNCADCLEQRGGSRIDIQIYFQPPLVGAAYYSDEFAVLDCRGWAHPYTLPLSIRSANGEPTKIPIEQLGGERGTEPLPVALIVLTQYQRRAHWCPRELSPAQAMLALMDNTVAARREPEYTMPILRETVLHAKSIESKRGEAVRVAPALLKLPSA